MVPQTVPAARVNGCHWRVIPTSHLHCTNGDVVEDETWHYQLSDICPNAVSTNCFTKLSDGYDITSIQLLYLILGSCWGYI